MTGRALSGCANVHLAPPPSGCPISLSLLPATATATSVPGGGCAFASFLRMLSIDLPPSSVQSVVNRVIEV